MKLSIVEHHGYFTMDMNCFWKYNFDNSVCKNSRLCMIFVKEGTINYELNGVSISSYAPCLLCINELDNFSMHCSKQACIIVFHPNVINSSFTFENIKNNISSFSVSEEQDCFFLKSFLKRNDDFQGLFFLDYFISQRISQLIKQVEKEINDQDSYFWSCKSRSYLIEILSLIQNTLVQTNTSKKEDLVSTIKLYLNSHISEKITISHLTKHFNCNRTDLSKIFLNKTGTTIMSYLRNQRMEFAATLIRSTGLSFTVIMERTGFSQYSYFSRCFHLHTGKSPREYRKIYGQYPDA